MVKNKKESDSAYFLKIILFIILGTFWLRLDGVSIGPFEHLSLPAGFLLGLLFAMHDRFQIDRKIEYAVLLTSTIMSFYLPVGIII